MMLIRVYQGTLSPLLGGQCRFYPSCSEYARLSFATRPLGQALILNFRRLLRCHPFSAGGVDWPPETSPKILHVRGSDG